jgi:hypothetical protein
MAVDSNVLTVNNASVTFEDGTGTPVTLTLTNDTTVTIDGFTGASLNDIAHFQRRGKHFSSQHTQRIYPTITIEFLHNGFVGDGSAPGTPLEFALFQGTYSSNTSTTSVGTRGVKTINITVAEEGTDFGGADGELKFEDCVLRNHTPLSDGEPSTYSMTFEITGATDDAASDLSYDEA